MLQASASTTKQVHALATRMVATCREMNATGLNQGISGNLSVRCDDGFLITPTSTAYDAMTPEDIVHCDREGRVISGGRASSESPFHRDILKARPDLGDIDAVWACWDVPLVGATQAIADAGRSEIRTYGMDGSPDFIEMVADPDSPAGAVIVQELEKMGRTSDDNVARYLAGEEVAPFTLLEARLVTKDNAQEVLETLAPAEE